MYTYVDFFLKVFTWLYTFLKKSLQWAVHFKKNCTGLETCSSFETTPCVCVEPPYGVLRVPYGRTWNFIRWHHVVILIPKRSAWVKPPGKYHATTNPETTFTYIAILQTRHADGNRMTAPTQNWYSKHSTPSPVTDKWTNSQNSLWLTQPVSWPTGGIELLLA